jgi:predicted Rossmann-fold nucleotide-binding protein
MIIAITGGRDRKPTAEQLVRFHELLHEHDAAEVLHGDCRGVDRAVADYIRRKLTACTECDVIVTPMPAIWYPQPGKLDRSAGHKRNAEMVSRCRLLVSFGGGNGTAGCVAYARRAGVPVIDLSEMK